MPILHAIVLGLVQGLTEFLPVSSSGHLAVVPWLFGWKELTRHPDLNQTFDVALHIGTFVGAVAYFWRDIWEIVFDRSRHRLGLLLIVATIPAGIAGALFEEALAKPSIWLIGLMLIVFGLVLACRRLNRGIPGKGRPAHRVPDQDLSSGPADLRVWQPHRRVLWPSRPAQRQPDHDPPFWVSD